MVGVWQGSRITAQCKVDENEPFCLRTRIIFLCYCFVMPLALCYVIVIQTDSVLFHDTLFQYYRPTPKHAARTECRGFQDLQRRTKNQLSSLTLQVN